MRRTACLVLLGLALAACGEGDDDGDAGENGAASEGAAVVEADEGIDGVLAIRIESRDHTDGDVDYDRSPPAGGDHNETWVNCGFYDEPFEDENLVHDLEHGAVWLAYAPSLAAADIDVIHELVRANEKVVATPYEDLAPGVAVVASAWSRQLELDSVADPRLEQFVEQYQDGDQAPEAGVTCRDSPLGAPIP